ncbi:MAG: DUF2628 domain-containing protein [Hyphomicrobiaceae bacterium]|nr:MAG: DUF2628 domain-containing protein [Hyphomicrobiaceae bacterium]
MTRAYCWMNATGRAEPNEQREELAEDGESRFHSGGTGLGWVDDECTRRRHQHPLRRRGQIGLKAREIVRDLMVMAKRQHIYTVHEPAQPPADPLQRCEGIELVKEGFSWPAFVFAPLWLIANRMWLVLAGFAAMWLAVHLFFMTLPGGLNAVGLAWLVISLGFGLEANELRRWTLERSGYRMIAFVAGNSLDECEHRFFQSWLSSAPSPRAPAAPPPVPPPAQIKPASEADMASRIRGIADGMRRDLISQDANPTVPKTS